MNEKTSEQNLNDSFPFRWSNPVYYTLDKELEIIDKSELVPKEWNKARYIYPLRKSKSKVSEEVYITLLYLFPEEFIGEELYFLNRSYWWGKEDIIAIDDLWRVHIIETKNDACSLKDLKQLELYLNQKSFINLKGFVQDNINHFIYQKHVTKSLIFGLFAGAQTSRIQKDIVSKTLITKIKEKDWKNHDNKAEYIAQYLMLNIVKIWNYSVTKEFIENLSNKIFEKLISKKKIIEQKCQHGVNIHFNESERRSVLWLVGTDFKKDVIDKVQEHRGNKLDVRLLKMEVRISKGLNKFLVKIQKENFPKREEITKDLVNWLNNNSGSYQLKIQFYSDHAPSKNKKVNDGYCLNKPIIEVIDRKTYKPVKKF